jgi:L-threonylcarbamoyladenylate synthase
MSEIEKAANIIKQGGLVAFPTETVYGLGADATNQEACLGIFRAKGRPAHNPLIVHVGSIEEAKNIAYFNEDAEKISDLWPGPVTLVLPRKKTAKISDCVTAGLDTVAIRIPSEPTALNLLNASKRPIAAPSANKSGSISSTTTNHVRANFDDRVFILSSNNRCTYGLESTILDLSSEVPTLLRLGFYTPKALEKIINKEIMLASKLSKIKAPGMLLRHYAPTTTLRLNATSLNASEVGLNFGNSQLKSQGSLNLSNNANLLEAASNLYDYLYILDNLCQQQDIKSIAVANIPQNGIGLAINDRLTRASESIS